jgi:putative component of membrane protein insertase Oxa1/YidC/SpoIIIJ protein YidD
MLTNAISDKRMRIVDAKVDYVNFCNRKFIYNCIKANGALTPYPVDLNRCQSCKPASEDGLKESPKHVRKK